MKFNKYFFDQFQNTSCYDINIDFTNDPMYDINFSCTRVKQFLDAININKAPYGIHGCVYCSRSLCRPLSIIFKLSYKTGIILVTLLLSLLKHTLSNLVLKVLKICM